MSLPNIFVTIFVSFIIVHFFTKNIKSFYRKIILRVVLVLLIGGSALSFLEHKQALLEETTYPISRAPNVFARASFQGQPVYSYFNSIYDIYHYFNSIYKNFFTTCVTTPFMWPRNLPASIFKVDTVGGVNGAIVVDVDQQKSGLIVSNKCILYPGSGKIVVPSSVTPELKKQIITAFNLLVASAEKYGINPRRFKEFDIYIELPNLIVTIELPNLIVTGVGQNLELKSIGGTSIGVNIFVALLSAFTNCSVKSDIVMTGTLTAEGLIKKIGELNTKAMAASEAGIFKVLCPLENVLEKPNLPDVEFVFCKTIDDVVQNAFSLEDLAKMKKGEHPIPLTPAGKAKKLADAAYVKVLEKRDTQVFETMIVEFMSVQPLYEKAASLYEKEGNKRAAAECVEMLIHIKQNHKYIIYLFKKSDNDVFKEEIKLHERAALLYDQNGDKKAAAQKIYDITSLLESRLIELEMRNDFSDIDFIADSLIEFSERVAAFYTETGNYYYAAQSLNKAALGLRFYILARVICAFNFKFSEEALQALKKKHLEVAEMHDKAAKLYDKAGRKRAAARCVDSAGATLNQCAAMLLKVGAITNDEFSEIMNRAREYYLQSSIRFAENKRHLGVSMLQHMLSLPVNFDPNSY